MSKRNLMNTYARFDAVFVEGRGAKLIDINGVEYLDFVSGVAVNALGHSHPAITGTISEQSQRLMHVSNLYWTPQQIELADKLVSYSDHHQVFFCNSGTEGIELGLKIARKYGKRKGGKEKTQIIYFKHSFHGRTMGALSVTGQEKYQADYQPLVPDTILLDFNDIQQLEHAFSHRVCGVILEPIQGEGGIVEADLDSLKKVRELCDQYDALLIFDEVQAGMGRLGTLFAYQSVGVVPDILCMAKGLGGGFPIGAILANQRAAVMEPGDHGCTFGGNPLACSVAITVLDQLVHKGVLENVKESSHYLISKLEELKEKYPIIQGIQGKGLLLGIKCRKDPKEIIQRCFDNRLLLVGAGQNVIRVLPPLNVTREDMDQFLTILEDVLKEVEY